MPAALWPQMGSIFIAFALAVASAELHRRLITMSHRLDIAQKRFLRSRNSVNTAAGSAQPCQAQPGLRVVGAKKRIRRKFDRDGGRKGEFAGLALPCDLAARAFKSALEGSTVSANVRSPSCIHARNKPVFPRKRGKFHQRMIKHGRGLLKPRPHPIAKAYPRQKECLRV